MTQLSQMLTWLVTMIIQKLVIARLGLSNLLNQADFVSDSKVTTKEILRTHHSWMAIDLPVAIPIANDPTKHLEHGL